MNTQPPEQTPRQNPDFSERLIAAQRVEPSLRQRYEQEMQAMLEPTLNRTRKVSFTLSLAVSAVMAVALTLAAVTTTRAPLAMRIGLGLGALYAAGWGIIMFRILRRGRLQLRSDSQWTSGLPWAFAVAMMTLLLVVTGQKPDSVRSVWMLCFGLTFLIGAAMFLLQHWISDARLKVEERLLETQLRVAELAEELKKRA